jgi:hypothetical protein
MSNLSPHPTIFALIVFLLIGTPVQSQSRDQLPLPDFDVATAEFSTDTAYVDAIYRLDKFFKDQIKLGADKIFPKVSENIHFEIWRNMWFEFIPKDPNGLRIKIVSWEPSGIYDDVSKSVYGKWKQENATLLGANDSLVFGRLGKVATVSSIVPAALDEIDSLLRKVSAECNIVPVPNMLSITNTNKLPLGIQEYICTKPRVRITVRFDRVAGITTLTAKGEDRDVIGRITDRVKYAGAKQRIATVLTARDEVERAISEKAMRDIDDAKNKIESSRPGLHVDFDIRGALRKTRESPEFQTRLADAANRFLIKFRSDRKYQKLNVDWYQLEGSSSALNQYSTPRLLTTTEVTDVPYSDDGQLFVASIKLFQLPTGKHRIAIKGQGLADRQDVIDDRIYNFDGATFVEQ